MKFKITACIMISVLLVAVAGCATENIFDSKKLTSYITSDSSVSTEENVIFSEEKEVADNSVEESTEIKIESETVSGGNEEFQESKWLQESEIIYDNEDEFDKSKIDFVTNTQKKMIMEINGQKYLWSKALYKLLDDYSNEKISNENVSSYYFGSSVMDSVISGNVIYESRNGIICMDLSDVSGQLNELISSDQLREQFKRICVKETGSSTEKLDLVITNLTDGGNGFIYFETIPLGEVHNCLKYRIGRFSKDGSIFELFENARASAFTISGEYIYYYDNGYNYKSNSFMELFSGVYYMTLDGNSQKLLFSHKPVLINDKYNGTIINQNDCTIRDMNVIGDKLYYLRNSKPNDGDPREGELYSYDLNTFAEKRISSGKCHFYYIDALSNTLYYGEPTNKLPGDFRIISKQLGGDGENVLIESIFLSDYTYDFRISNGISPVIYYSDGYLYFCGGNYYSQNYKTINEESNSAYKPEPSASRYNIRSGEMDYLYLTCYAEATKDELGFPHSKIVGYEMGWEK